MWLLFKSNLSQNRPCVFSGEREMRAWNCLGNITTELHIIILWRFSVKKEKPISFFTLLTLIPIELMVCVRL